MATRDKLTRIAIVNTDRCKPKKCRQECKKACPVVRMGTYVLHNNCKFKQIQCLNLIGNILEIKENFVLRLHLPLK